MDKLTPEEISRLSDKKLDLALCQYLEPETWKCIQAKPTDVLYRNEILSRPTKSWSYLMPLVVEHGISSMHQAFDDSWIADQFHGEPAIGDNNLQLALCKCLLAVLQAKEKDDE